jgi:metal-dependent amidase/aminoacylase/carboxypeptidase family protein
MNYMILNYETIRSSFHTDSSPQRGRAGSTDASWMQAKAPQQARVKAAILLGAMSAPAIFSTPCTMGFPWTRTAAHSLLNRLLHNAHMTIKSEAPATACGVRQRDAKSCSIKRKDTQSGSTFVS